MSSQLLANKANSLLLSRSRLTRDAVKIFVILIFGYARLAGLSTQQPQQGKTETHTAYKSHPSAQSEDGDWKAEALDLQQKIKEKPLSPGFHSQLAELLLSHGERGAALVEFREAARVAPDVEILERLAKVLYDGGDVEASSTELCKLIDQRPNAGDVHLNLARVLAEEGLLTGAIAESKEALRIDPGNIDAQRNLAYDLKQKQKGDQRIMLLRKQIMSSHAKADSFMELAFLLWMNDGDPQTALQTIREGLRRHPNDPKLSDYEKLLMSQTGLQ